MVLVLGCQVDGPLESYAPGLAEELSWRGYTRAFLVSQRAIFGRSATRNALRAWSRCQPVVAHNSLRILRFSALPVRR